VPLLPDVLELISQGMLTRGDKNNRDYVGETISFAPSVSGHMQSALFDPQTAGGLLISMTEENGSRFLSEMPDARAIGRVKAKTGHLIEVS
jgi:selenide, water dikinase